jgi:Protein of unknown function (DUF3237)
MDAVKPGRWHMPETSLPVEHLFTFTGTVGRGMTINAGPMGTRVVVPVLSATFEGQKLRGKVADAPAGDWVYSRADGSIKLVVRVTLLTDDGAVILMTYSGIGVPAEGAMALRTAPQFETGDERYGWLNNIQAVGIGTFGRGTVTHDVYALR